MPKNIHTPREDLICGKIDKAREIAVWYQDAGLCDILDAIRHDAQRMEAKLVSRRDEALPAPPQHSGTIGEG